jgi:hypothetical protein
MHGSTIRHYGIDTSGLYTNNDEKKRNEKECFAVYIFHVEKLSPNITLLEEW